MVWVKVKVIFWVHKWYYVQDIYIRPDRYGLYKPAWQPSKEEVLSNVDLKSEYPNCGCNWVRWTVYGGGVHVRFEDSHVVE